MSVEFNEPEFTIPSQREGQEPSGIARLIIKLGLAKNVAQANIVMLVISLISAGLAIYLVLPSRTPPPSGAVEIPIR